MHQPTADPRPSIYYAYRVHAPAPAVADPGLQVLVVGAGPIGLVTALGLAQQGVRVAVLESELQVSEGSRAIVFTRRSMEILQQAGVAERITAKGLPWRFGNSFYRGQRVFRMEAPHRDDDRFFPMTNLQQPYVEEYLLDALAAFPHAQVRWGHKVTRLLAHDPGSGDAEAAAGVTLEIDTPTGAYVQRAPWVVAADGARSVLRAACDLKLEGAAYEGRFVIADIRIDLPLPTERLAFFDPPWNPGNTVLMHRQPDAMWRIDYQLPPDETPEQALEPASLKARIDAQLAMIGLAGVPWEMDWSSVYSAREIVQEAGKSTRFMTPPTRGFRLLRDAVLSLSLTQDFVRPLYHWRTSRPHDYLDTPLNAGDDDSAGFAAGPVNGAPLPNLRWDEGFLLDWLCGDAAGCFSLIVDDAATLAPWPDGPDPAAVQVLVVPGALGQALGLRGTGSALLVRPDQHVCARWLALTPPRLQAALRRALGHAT